MKILFAIVFLQPVLIVLLACFVLISPILFLIWLIRFLMNSRLDYLEMRLPKKEVVPVIPKEKREGGMVLEIDGFGKVDLRGSTIFE